jgi:ribonuclease J
VAWDTVRCPHEETVVPALEIVPLGGLGEFGMNMMAIAYGDRAIVVDAGIMFPDTDLPGVDLIIPDPTHLEKYAGNVDALVLTHGHEDHIGAVPHVLPHVDGPLYGTPLTLALAEPKLSETVRPRLRPVRPRESVTAGPFQIEFLHVTHSMPDCVALAIHTPVGTIVHTGDFKIDQTPLNGEHTDIHRLAQLGSQGVLALFADSTNVERSGYTGSELEVSGAFEEILASTSGKVVVALFASSLQSSLHRMQVVINLATQFGRKVAFVGRGIVENAQIASRLGHLKVPAGMQIRDTEVKSYPAQDVLCLCTGSQGEPMAALPRIAIDDHRHVTVGHGDVVVFSARQIPGNEKAIGRAMNHLSRRGAEVIADGTKHVHVSGHASDEELKLLLSLVRPRHFVPIHGEYRQLARHARVAAQVSPETNVLLAEDGDVVRLDAEAAWIEGKAPAGRVLIDGTRTGEVGDEVLRDRRHLAADGLIVSVLAIGKQTGALEESPSLITRGFVVDERTDALLREVPGVLAQLVERTGVEERTDPGLIKDKVRMELQRFFRKRSGRRPLVLPIIMEI